MILLILPALEVEFLYWYYDASYPDPSFSEADTTLTIDQSNFTTNKNFLPYKQFRILINGINTGIYYYQNSIPLQGAGGIAIVYLQSTYDVNATISNSMFYNNNGTLSASIAIGSYLTIRGKTFIKYCLFEDSNRINRSYAEASTATTVTGGISYYATLINAPLLTYDINSDTVNEMVTVMHCNFTKLGGSSGAAIHIERKSTDSQHLTFRIEECVFVGNEANVGSAVYAVDHRFDTGLSNSLIVDLVNVSAVDNALIPGSTVEYVTSDFITGVFHSETCHLKFDCNTQCIFLNNQPTAIYGRSAYVTISGKAIFVNNTALYGGGLRLLDTVAFIHQDSELYFGNNRATISGGAIDVYFPNAIVQSRPVCPIQFIGNSNDTIFSLKNIDQIHVNITFEENTALSSSGVVLESIYANVFYVCNWYSHTLTQINLGISVPFINGTRQSVYRTILHFIPASTANKHLSIKAYLPCPCNNNNSFDAESCFTTDSNYTMQLETPVIMGRSFTISLVALDVVGSVGYSSYLNSEVFSLNTTDNILQLPKDQLSRSFSIVNKTCTPIDFTIYALQSTISETGHGLLQLSISQNFYLSLHFSFHGCPIGFNLQNVSGLYACICSEFFSKSPIKEDFECNSESGQIRRTDIRSWLSVIDDRIEYKKVCLPEYCNNIISEFSTTDNDALCNPDRTGRGCGACVNGFGKVFGSRYCQKCSNIWLLTIILYGILGVILVLIIHMLRLTVTMGTINGLIFFCNIMSINESLFFNTLKFSFVRLFISLINLDLGFEMCFYEGMSELVKTGVQFIFPLYLWLLMFIIIMIGKRYIRSKKSTHSAVPVLATLIFLSYSKLLRTAISVFSFVTVHYSTKESDFSSLKLLVAWQPDLTIKYLQDGHVVLFLIALVFTAFFILPLAFALTFPKIVLRSKKMSYFFPLLDCFYAPYKNRYRNWFGVRIMVLIYFSALESFLFSHQGSLLLFGIVVVLLFALIQSYIHPFKNTIHNILDLTFMGFFIILSIIVLYLYPNTPGHEEFIAVNIIGSFAFLLFCLIITFHVNDALMHFTWYSRINETLKTKLNKKVSKLNWNPLNSIITGDIDTSPRPDNGSIDGNLNYAYLQEPLLDEEFN